MSLWRSLFSLLDPRSHLQERLVETQAGALLLEEAPGGERGGVHWRDIVFNGPLVYGGLIVLGLFLAVLFGPLWAPVNPYIAGQHIVPHKDLQTGEWITPPLSPSSAYPLGTDEWGNDIWSMLLYGARNTLVACAFIAMARVLLGTFLGAYAGWNPGGLVDTTIMGLIGVVTSVPLLISSMILIYALDIRRGLPVFIIALAVMGWTEIAQYIRSEFLVLRTQPYIEGARAVGTRGPAIAVRHVLPNLLPQLLVISFLELGAVLMLLGELSFVGVFIGGGSRIAFGDELTGIQFVTRSQVPEWGAMLAEGYRWLRAKPFIVFPPAFAFFISVSGFNALGEGLRRLIEKYHLSTNFMLRKRMLLVIAGLSFATVFIINNTGPAPWFARVARSFDGTSALNYTRDLAGMDGRGAGQAGGEEAAAYIAARFAEYGLDPGWQKSQYFYPFEVALVEPLAQPELALLDSNGDAARYFQHQLDFSYRIDGHAGSGSAAAPLAFVGFDPQKREYTWQDFKGLDLRGRIVLLLEGNAPPDFLEEALIRGAQGVLWVAASESETLRSQNQLADPEGTYLARPTVPAFSIRPAAAEAILSAGGLSLTDLQEAVGQARTAEAGWAARLLEVNVRMALDLSAPRRVEIPCVLGFIPGSDYDLAGELVVLYANYDGLGQEPDGTVFQGANRNAAGVGVLLELARTWQEQELNPRRSVLFVAWGSGQLAEPGARGFLQNGSSFRHLPNPNPGRALAPAAIFQLDGTGAGGEELFIHPSSTHALSQVMRDAAESVGLEVVSDKSLIDSEVDTLQVPQASWVYFNWANAGLPPDQDRLEIVQAEKLQALGETLSLALTRVVRETTY